MLPRRPRRAAPLAAPLAALLLAGCVALHTPPPPAPAPAAAPLPLRVALCPAAAEAGPWLADAGLFARLDSLGAGAAGAPDLLVVDAANRYRDGWKRGTSLADVLAIATLGVLPKMVTHEAEAHVTFRRPTGGAADCAPLPAGAAAAAAGTLTVRAARRERELIAFWFIAPALVATLPGWDFRPGDAPRPRLDAVRWLVPELHARRADLLRLAGR